ncbi:MAG: TolC family protein [Proteobacteria bacterium]|nr:TolC family protein [Pseudomonadota bacterium]
MNMANLQKTQFIPLISALVILVASVGCIRPDHWPAYEQSLTQTILEEIPTSQSEHKEIDSLPDPVMHSGVPTGNSLSLSLDQALVMALEANSGLRVEKYNPVLANLSEEIERGRFDPELFSEFSIARDRTQEKDPDTSTWGRAGEQSHNALIGLSQKLPSGTDIEVGVAHMIDNTYQGPEEQKLRMGMTVTQSLLRGYGPLVNLASIRQAQLNTAATIYELRGITEALLADTETAYWDHVLARQEIDIFENSLDIAKKQLSEVEQRIEIGTLPPIESAAAKVEVALREQALINAKSRFEESRLRLLFYIHQGRDGQYDLQVQTTSAAVSEPETIVVPEDHLQLADQSRSDLQEARLRMKQHRLEIVKTRNGILPRLDLFISLGKTGYADSFSGSFKAMNDSFYDLSAGIKFSRTLGNRSTQAKDRAARVTLKQAQEALENMRQIIQRDVRIALNDLDRVKQQIPATRVTRIHQQESVKAEQERFEAGTSTGLIVAQAQRDLLAAHILEKEAIIDYNKALVKLYLAEGSLLERRGVHTASFLSEPLP